MTVIFLCRLFYPHIGGVEKHVLKISKILIKKGYKIIVFTEQFDSKLKLHDNIEGVEIHRIPIGKEDWFKKFRIWAWLWKHRNLIKGANIVHCHDVFFWHLPFRFIYFNKPLFTTFHGYEGNNLPSKKAIFMHKIAEKLSNGNICVGDFLKKWYGTKSDYVTYGAVDLKFQNSKFKIQSHNSRLKVLFIGRLEEETGIMEYLKALKILKEKAYELRLDVLGDGSQRGKAKKFCKKFDLNVRFYGFVNNINKFLSGADFVFTSRYLGILEALATNKLVFALYNNEIKKDYLKMTPFAKWVVIENSSKNLTDKILYFINHDEQKKNVSKAYEWVKNQTWDKVVNLYLKLWELKSLGSNVNNIGCSNGT